MDSTGMFDQLIATLRDVAPALASYREHLLKHGFTKHEAFLLTIELQKSMFASAGGQKQ